MDKITSIKTAQNVSF